MVDAVSGERLVEDAPDPDMVGIDIHISLVILSETNRIIQKDGNSGRKTRWSLKKAPILFEPSGHSATAHAA